MDTIVTKQPNTEYKAGFVTQIKANQFTKGLDENVVRKISKIKNEPEFMLEYRLKAFRNWKQMQMPKWAYLDIPEIDFQNIRYYSAPKSISLSPEHLGKSGVDSAIVETFNKLGIPIEDQAKLGNVAIDAVFDSVSVKTTHQVELKKLGIIFCSISEALQNHPELVKQYLGSVVPYNDNYFAALNAAVFSDGSFVYIPKGVQSPFELSTYFRINSAETGQFERTLIIADENSFVNYVEGCSAPIRPETQLHAAVVELVAMKDAQIKYSTVQNWYAGDENGQGGIYNFVTKRGKCLGNNSKISWTQVEVGSAITWKYPSCVLIGENSVGSFYSVALTNNHMQADTGTKMIHVGKNTTSTIISKGISTGKSRNSYRGMVKMTKSASNSRNYTQCDSMLVGDKCNANTFPVIDVQNNSSVVEHEASTSRISEEQLFYLQSRGIQPETAVSMIVNGFCGDVFKELPLEFAVEAQKILNIKLSSKVG